MSLRTTCAYAQFVHSLGESLEYSMIGELLDDDHSVFLSLKGDCAGSSESTQVTACLTMNSYT